MVDHDGGQKKKKEEKKNKREKSLTNTILFGEKREKCSWMFFSQIRFVFHLHQLLSLQFKFFQKPSTIRILSFTHVTVPGP